MKTIVNARIFDGLSFLPATSVSFENGLIAALGNETKGIDASGMLLTPGLIDVHMHGQHGLNSHRAGDNAKMAQTQPAHGVTCFMPAAITETDTNIRAYLADIKGAMALKAGARIPGAYLEGPYLADKVKGTHDAKKLKDPSLAHYKHLTAGYEDIIRKVTLAPEKPGGYELVSFLAQSGVIVSIGHSAASSAEAVEAFDCGVTCSAHTFNGMIPMHHRDPGTAGAVLTDDRIMAEFIADLVHIDPIMIRLILKAKGPGNCYFCTDSMEAAGMPDGSYHIGNEEVNVIAGIARCRGVLAGSTLTMEMGLKNLIKAGIPPDIALRLCTYNPAKCMRLTGLGHLAPGAAADLVLWHDDLSPSSVFIRGKAEYGELCN